MSLAAAINYTDNIMTGFFRWRRELDMTQNMMLATAYACLTGLLAQINFYLPWTPVPVTGGTFAVFLGALLLGRWAVGSQLIYVTAGAIGLPWFASEKGGLAAIAGPTGGYIIGFIVAAYLLGWWFDKRACQMNLAQTIAAMTVANFVVVYGLGLLQLQIWLVLTGTPANLWNLLLMGAIPFVIGDSLKILVAAIIGKSLMPKKCKLN